MSLKQSASLSLYSFIILARDEEESLPEITAKLARTKCVIYEVGISYHGRTYEEGGKIGVKDGFRAIYAILNYNIWARK